MLKAFLTATLLFFLQAASAQKISIQNKISPGLAAKVLFGKEDSLDIIIQADATKSFLKLSRLVTAYHSIQVSLVRVRKEDVHAFLLQPAVLFADLYFLPKEELTTGSLDISTNKINYSHSEYPTINGLNIRASIKENRFDTTDIDIIGRAFHSGVASIAGTTHATIVATALAGAGNSSPYAKGVAFKSLLTSSNFASIMPDPDSIFNKYNITIQNHSYGTVIQNYYGIEAVAYDVHAYTNPTIFHAFSSGNTGTDSATSGKYSGIKGVSNHTGNFKWAKNTITVGATDSFYNVAALSSRGPAFDGRIKPELVAFAEGGSSGAVALVSGTAALLQQAYYEKYQRYPSSALLKAILINSADDVGPAGIDFYSGFGSLNAQKAVKTIIKNQFIEETAGQNQTKSFVVTIPANAANMKVTLVWTDPAAKVNAAKALVNDLDLVVTHTTTGTVWRPWVLNTFPHPDSLSQPAKRSIDTLNNIEQITIENLQAGNYAIEVRGTQVTGSQSFAIAYQIDSSGHFEWTFPARQDQIESGIANTLRWETTMKGVGKIEFSEDKQNWGLLSSSVDVEKGYYKWMTPVKFSNGFLRMTSLNSLPVISDTFTISQATSLHTAYNCADSFMLYWNKLPVNAYQLYKLNGNYLQPFFSTADTSIVISKANEQTLYYAVAPIIAGKAGLRSFTLKYNAQGVDCYFKSFYLQSQSPTEASFTAAIGTTHGIQSIQFQKLQNNTFTSLKSLGSPTALTFLFSDSLLSKGVNVYRMLIVLQNGRQIVSNMVTVYHFENEDLIVYPNPVQQYAPINFITRISGRISIEIFNDNGVLVKKIELKNLLNPVPAFMLSKGIYFLRATTHEGKQFSQKLVVY